MFLHVRCIPQPKFAMIAKKMCVCVCVSVLRDKIEKVAGGNVCSKVVCEAERFCAIAYLNSLVHISPVNSLQARGVWSADCKV